MAYTLKFSTIKGGNMSTYLTDNMQFFGDMIANKYVVTGVFLVLAFFMVIITFAFIASLVRNNSFGGK